MLTRSLLVASLCVGVFASTPACQKKQKSLLPQVKRPKFAPAPMVPRRNHESEVHKAKLRVFGDHEFRAQQVDWQREVRVMIDDANQMLVPEFGVRLEVVDFQEWTRQAPDGDLSKMLSELEDRESGADVDWVIGMVSAHSQASSDVTELGAARPLGKHFIMRGYNDTAEHKLLSDEISSEVARLRKQHKQKTVFLHELGHTLGSLHANGIRSAVMNSRYSDKVTEFAAANSAVITEVLSERMQRPADPLREAKVLRKLIEVDTPWPGWAPAEHADVLERAKSLAAEASGTDGAGGDPKAAETGTEAGKIPPRAGILYRRVGELLRKGETDAAWAELQALMQAYPAQVEFRMTACQLWMRQKPLGEEAQLHCQRVGELDPANIAGELMLAAGYVQASKLPDAHALLTGVLTRIKGLPDKQQELWNGVAAIYRGLSAVTWAEAAIAAAPEGVDTAPLRTWTRTTRRRYGLPKNGKRHGITPEREGEYITQVRAVLQLTYAKQYKKARKLARKGLRQFKNGPGFLGALCDLEYRARNYPGAHGRCSAALRYFGDASWSRYLMGILELRKKRNQSGIKHLRRAIANDPDLKQAYHALYQAYARVRNKKAMSELRANYYDRFGVPLPTK